ncbi:hypothetical protein D3C85_1539710 [compost metagenome]
MTMKRSLQTTLLLAQLCAGAALAVAAGVTVTANGSQASQQRAFSRDSPTSARGIRAVRAVAAVRRSAGSAAHSCAPRWLRQSA